MSAVPPDLIANTPGARSQIEFDDNLLLPLLYGERDAHLDQIERQLGVALVPRGNRLVISGSASATEVAHLALSHLYDQVKRGQEIDIPAVDAALRFAQTERDDKNLSLWREEAGFRTRKRRIAARTAGQALYVKAMREHELVFGLGPAGTGKTYLAVAAAVDLLMTGRVERIILSRPAVEAGERLGFLPGDLREKVDPYLRPIFDALNDMLPADQLQKRLGAACLHARPHAGARVRDPRRGAEYDAGADEDVPHPARRGLAHGGDRRPDADRPAAGHEIRARRRARRARGDRGCHARPLHRARRRAPPARRPHRRRL
jgi:phosphate starvation-inducible protein PhoH